MTIKGQLHGSKGELMAFANALNEREDVLGIKPGRFYPGKDPDKSHQFFEILMKPATRWEPRREKARPEYPGIVYLAQSLTIEGKFKIGESEDVRRRVGELERKFGETFKIIHVIICRDRFACEAWMHKEVVRWGAKALGKECFMMTDQHVEQFIAQENQL